MIKTLHFLDDLKIGKNCLVGSKTFLEKNVQIGDFTYLNSATQIMIDSNVTIGKYCSIGPGVNIAQGNHKIDMVSTHPFLYDKYYAFAFNINEKQFECEGMKDRDAITIIGNDVWIGMNAIIKRGAVIGNGAVIGAGAVVTKSVPDYAVVAGNPAKIIKYRFTELQIEKLLESKWWNWDLEFVKSRIATFYDINKFILEEN